MALTDYIPTPVLPENRKLGRAEVKERPTLKLDKFFEPKATTRPKEVHRSLWNKSWPMFGNGPDSTITLDRNLAEWGCGDCVLVDIYKSIMHLHYGAKTPVGPISANTVVKQYGAVTGFDPNQTDSDGYNPTDQGTDPVQAYNHWKKVGYPLDDGSVDQIVGYAEVDVSNIALVETAIWQFDVISLSLALPISAQSQTKWTVTNKRLTGNASPGSWGGHEVPAVSYDGSYFAFYTWGTIMLLSYEFLSDYCDLILVPLSKDILNYSGVSETGINWTGLNQALAAL